MIIWAKKREKLKKAEELMKNWRSCQKRHYEWLGIVKGFGKGLMKGVKGEERKKKEADEVEQEF